MSADATRLKGVTDIRRSLLSDTIESNLCSFFQWAFLGVGGFFNVSIPASGAYGGDLHRLRPLTDPAYQDGRCWQGYRQDWVWETGVDWSTQPIRVSGVYVNGTFHPAAETGTYAHKVNYPLGRVIFDNPVSVTGVVTCEYSHRYVNFTTSDCLWWREVQTESFRGDDPHFAQLGSGAWAILSQSRVQLPAVVVEVLPTTSRRGLALGGGDIVRQEVLFSVLTETPWDRNQLHDAITYQWQKRFVMFDKNRLADADRFPLDEDGAPATGALMYPDLIKPSGEGGFGFRQLRCEDFRSVAQPREVTAPLYVATIRGSFETDL